MIACKRWRIARLCASVRAHSCMCGCVLECICSNACRHTHLESGILLLPVGGTSATKLGACGNLCCCPLPLTNPSPFASARDVLQVKLQHETPTSNLVEDHSCIFLPSSPVRADADVSIAGLPLDRDSSGIQPLPMDVRKEPKSATGAGRGTRDIRKCPA